MARILDIAVVTVGLIGTSLLGASVAAGADVCTCRAPGGRRVELGGTTCLATPAGPRLARCVMDVNILSWQILDIPCPVSEAPHSIAPWRTTAASPATGPAAFDPR